MSLGETTLNAISQIIYDYTFIPITKVEMRINYWNVVNQLKAINKRNNQSDTSLFPFLRYWQNRHKKAHSSTFYRTPWKLYVGSIRQVLANTLFEMTG